MFQRTHFGKANGAFGMHLCHVLAWANIRCVMDALLQDAFIAESKESAEPNEENYAKIREFISKLFDPDDEAVVNFGAWYPPMTFDAWNDPSKPWFEQNPTKRSHAKGTKFMD